MKIIDLYTPFIKVFEAGLSKDIRKILASEAELRILSAMVEDWGMELENTQRWIKSHEYSSQKQMALSFVAQSSKVSEHVESIFKEKLFGEVLLSPSFMQFDGFARYDSGYHRVWFGVDHPDANRQYLEALMSHELSHVYRDHRPQVWGHLNKPLQEISRKEYLDNSTAEEHLVSEGLATLFSQVAFPHTPLNIHHYYFEEEMKWCLENFDLIDRAIRERMKADQDIWSFYAEDIITRGSPSRTQYFWAAKILSHWLPQRFPDLDFEQAVVAAHSLPASAFDCFQF